MFVIVGKRSPEYFVRSHLARSCVYMVEIPDGCQVIAVDDKPTSSGIYFEQKYTSFVIELQWHKNSLCTGYSQYLPAKYPHNT